VREDFPQLSKAVIGTYWPPVVVFLVSEAARVVTGATYDVTVGDSAHSAA
jgi:hypothetical protein